MKAYKQRDFTDCGAACIASICSHYDFTIGFQRIRLAAGTSRSGTTIQGILDAATTLGFSAKAFKADFATLRKVPLPAIAYVTTKEGIAHYVVVVEISLHSIKIMDPRSGSFESLGVALWAAQWRGIAILLAPLKQLEEIQPSDGTYRKIWRLTGISRGRITEILIGGIFITLLGFALMLYLRLLIDGVIINDNLRLLNLLTVTVIAAVTLRNLLSYFQARLINIVAQDIETSLVLGLLRKLMMIPHRVIASLRTVELYNRFNDSLQLKGFVAEALAPLILNFLVACVATAAIFAISPKLGLFGLVMMSIHIAICSLWTHHSKESTLELTNITSLLSAQMHDILGNLGMLRRFQAKDLALLRVETVFARQMELSAVSAKKDALYKSVDGWLSQMAAVGLLAYGSHLALDREITIGQLMASYMVLSFVNNPLSSILGSLELIQKTKFKAERLLETASLESENEHEQGAKFVWKSGDIRIVNLDFRYAGGPPIFQGLHVTIPEKQITILRGRVGAGKSTLLSILQGSFPPNGGSVVIGDRSIEDIDQGALRRHFVLAGPRHEIISGSVLENIALSREIDMERIATICKRLWLHSSIQRMPNKYSTMLLDGGGQLSAGLRQKICLARAFYHAVDWLLLDEPTTSLDRESADAVMQYVMELKNHGCSIVIATHDENWISLADVVVTLDERGRPDIGGRGDARPGICAQTKEPSSQATAVI